MTTETSPYPRNAPCPCGSKRKYKRCCINKNFEWRIDGSGQVYKVSPLNDQAFALLKAQRARFIEKHGREPGPKDLVFEGLEESSLRDFAAHAMREVGIAERFIYAHMQTGLLVTEENRNSIPERDLEEWDEALERFDSGMT